MKTALTTFLQQATANWQTTLSGVIVAIAQVGGQIGIPPKIVNWATIIAIIFGLISAKQQGVTGGTKFQGDGTEAAQQKAVQGMDVAASLSSSETDSVALRTPKPTP